MLQAHIESCNKKVSRRKPSELSQSKKIVHRLAEPASKPPSVNPSSINASFLASPHYNYKLPPMRKLLSKWTRVHPHETNRLQVDSQRPTLHLDHASLVQRENSIFLMPWLVDANTESDFKP